MIIREVGPEDAAEWLAMRRELWPDGNDNDVEIAGFFAGSLEEPEAVLVAEDDGLLIGVAEHPIVIFVHDSSDDRKVDHI